MDKQVSELCADSMHGLPDTPENTQETGWGKVTQRKAVEPTDLQHSF